MQYQSIIYISSLTAALMGLMAGMVVLRILIILTQALLDGEIQKVWPRVKNKLLAAVVAVMIPTIILFLKGYYIR